MTTGSPPFRARLILLGASNLTRGISTVVETARLTLGSPLEIFAALGHGRSFGMRSRVFLRSLPGILECGIWKALEESSRPAAHSRKAVPPTFALITDVGNDIMYGAGPAQVIAWIEQCIDRLAPHGACIGMTMLPIQSIRSVKRWQYAVVKNFMFPTRSITYEQAITQANELHDRLIESAQRRGVRLIESPPQWYGFDPIHIQMRHWAGAWKQILSGCLVDPDNRSVERSRSRASLRRWLRLRTRMPEKWWLFNSERGRAQPCLRLADGTTIALY